MEFREIVSGGSCLEGDAVGADLPMRPDRDFVKFSWTASCENDICRVEDGETVVWLPEILFIQVEI